MKEITIAGAGLAGLVLGNALRAKGVPVRLHEAGKLPRHRVCGEFISGRGTKVLRELGLGDCLAGALEHRTTCWYRGGRPALEAALPSPAAGLSRHRLDQALLGRFIQAGGNYQDQSRLRFDPGAPGLADCSGRAVRKSDWIGLKLHCLGLETRADLELHLGAQAYLGLSRVEGGRTNVCGLFHRRRDLSETRERLLAAYLRATGLDETAERLDAGQIDPDSHSAVAGIVFGGELLLDSRSLRLGDALGVIPPFTGNGMSIAIESAALAADPLHAYAAGHLEWPEAVARTNRACRRAFAGRLRTAGWLHPWIAGPRRQKLTASLARRRLLPFHLLYRLTH